jgi:hypothetical protein
MSNIWRVPGSMVKCGASSSQPGSAGSTALPAVDAQDQRGLLEIAHHDR